ncbi:hypothetical protein TWF106_004296 [Orbilia oligospora]|uniref:Peptidase A2 domain-containing protein n=1 Tax=Orbilia oligospora TaxID=2813651 RepID=A0A7C8Q367_ORBOL|nr:hypothetical protein TWF788_006170 [Orbilia oligospora]KAF3229377.1 hypothetical protein TWF106_004296 [Orbilia oligospora]
MEAVSLASGIAGLLSLSISIIGISYKYISSANKASKSEGEYIVELANLKLLFSRLQEVSHSSELGVSSKLLSSLPISECMRDLEQLHSKLKKRSSSRLFMIKFNKLSWPFVEEETLQLVKMLHRYREIFQTSLTTEGFVFTAMMLREVTLLKSDMQFETVLNWLSSANFEEKQRDVFQQYHPTSGRWFLDSAQFRKWFSAADTRLWCHGDPGAGKTVMTSMVINHISDHSVDNGVGLAFFYCDYQDQDKQTPDYLVASLTKQLVRRTLTLPSKLEELYQVFCKEHRLPKISELIALLLQVSTCFSQTYLIIDALDEADFRRHRRGILSALHELEAKQRSLKIFVTSRSHPMDIRNAYESGLNIKITASKSDIRDYITSCLTNDENLADLIQPKLRNEIVDHISEIAGGMFLLARLQMDSIYAATTVREIRNALKTMPSDLQKTFDVALERLQAQPKQHAALALRVLSWLTHAKRPFSVEELCHGLAVEPDTTSLDDENLPAPKLLINVCGGLVVIDRESSTIRLAHLTVREYFTRMTPQLFGGINVSIAESCVTYLSFDTFSTGVCHDDESLEIRLQDNPFLRYSAKHWGDHVRGEGEHKLLKLVSDFLQDRSKAACATQVEFLPRISYHGCYDVYYKMLTAVHMAANWGLTWVLHSLLQDSGLADINARDFDGKTALHHPCRLGNEAVMKILIDNGADIGVFDDYGRSPLRFAVDGGNVNAVKLLLRSGADINAPVDYHGGTALHWASRTGRAAIVEVLIDSGADMTVKCYDGRTALDYSRDNGYDTITTLLLLKAGTTGAHEKKESLHYYSREGNFDIVNELLNQGANVLAVEEGNTTALHLAALGGHEKVVELLLGNGADPFATAKDGRTILHRAVESGNDKVVRLILSQKPDIEAKDCYGRTPLHWAARVGNKELVTTLLEHGADPAAEDSHGRTPLQQAVYGGQKTIIEMLESVKLKA